MRDSEYSCVLSDNYPEDREMIFTFLACKYSFDWTVFDVVSIVDPETSKPVIELSLISIKSIYLNNLQNKFLISFYL